MANVTGLAGGISQGFQLGSNFFNTIDQRQRQNVQDQQNAELFQMQKDQFEAQQQSNKVTNELNQIKIGAARRQEADRVRVGGLENLVGKVVSGTYDPDAIVAELDALDIDFSPIQDDTLMTALNEVGSGKYDKYNPQHKKVVNFLMGKKVRDVIGNKAPNGEKIIDVMVTDIVPSPADPSMLVPELAVKTSSGQIYQAPITQNRTSDPNDPIVQISMDAAIQKAMGSRQLYQLLNTPSIKSAIERRIKQISAPYTTLQDGFAVNALTGSYEYVKPFKPTQPTKAALAMVATGEGPEAEKAQEALSLMDTNKIDSVTDLAIAAMKTDDPILKKQFEDTIALIAGIEAKAKAEETAAAFNATNDLQVRQEQALLQGKQDIQDLAGRREGLSKKIDETGEALRDVQLLQAQMEKIDPNDFGAFSEFRQEVDRIFATFGWVSEKTKQKIADLDEYRATSTKIGLIGLAYFKGAISEKELETAMALAPNLKNSALSNKYIVNNIGSGQRYARLEQRVLGSIYGNVKLDAGTRIANADEIKRQIGEMSLAAQVKVKVRGKDGKLGDGYEYRQFHEYRQAQLANIANGKVKVPDGADVELAIWRRWAQDTGQVAIVRSLSEENLKRLGVL